MSEGRGSAVIDLALEVGTVKAMYGRGFVTAILAGFEETLEALMAGVNEDARRELRALSGHIESTRLQLDLDLDVEDDGESQPEEHICGRDEIGLRAGRVRVRSGEIGHS